MPNYTTSIYALGKSGTKSRLIHLRQQAIEKATRNAALPVPPPWLGTLTPDTGTAGTDVELTLAGGGFSEGDTVNIGLAFGLVPSSVTEEEIIVTVRAVNVAEAGTLPVSVTDKAGKKSNVLNFTVEDAGLRRG